MRAKSAQELEDRWRATPWFADGSNTLNLRLRRALSWLGRAERESADTDAQFVFQWIAFNAMYGQAGTLPADEKDQDLRRDYFGKIVAFADAESVIYGAIWSVLRDEIEKMLDNRYVFEPYWKHRNNQAKYRDWEQMFRQAQERVARALRETRTRDVLCELFNRLYTLRNQLLHGGATWKSSVNRNQVEPGARIMSSLVPHFIEVMIDRPNDWGPPRYPVVQERGPQSGWTGTR